MARLTEGATSQGMTVAEVVTEDSRAHSDSVHRLGRSRRVPAWLGTGPGRRPELRGRREERRQTWLNYPSGLPKPRNSVARSADQFSAVGKRLSKGPVEGG